MYSTVIGKTSYQFNASSLPSLWVFNVKLFLSFFSYHIVSVILITLEVIVQKKKKLACLGRQNEQGMPSSPFSSYLLYTEDNRRTMLSNFITFFKVHFRFNYTYYS